MLKDRRPAEAVKASWIYAYFLSIHPDLVMQVTDQELEAELREMESLGMVTYDPISGGWYGDNAASN